MTLGFNFILYRALGASDLGGKAVRNLFLEIKVALYLLFAKLQNNKSIFLHQVKIWHWHFHLYAIKYSPNELVVI